jgi:hypothetical protein
MSYFYCPIKEKTQIKYLFSKIFRFANRQIFLKKLSIFIAILAINSCSSANLSWQNFATNFSGNFHNKWHKITKKSNIPNNQESRKENNSNQPDLINPDAIGNKEIANKAESSEVFSTNGIVKGSLDIPVFRMLDFATEGFAFDSSNGSVSSSSYSTIANPLLIEKFYTETLPQMGWSFLKKQNQKLFFVREETMLIIKIESLQYGSEKPEQDSSPKKDDIHKGYIYSDDRNNVDIKYNVIFNIASGIANLDNVDKANEIADKIGF